MDCQRYIFQGEPNSDKAWKELGMGNLTLKSKEGAEKGMKDAKATVVIRNEVSSGF
jgi:nuclear pore complex protein Nup50